MHRINTVPAPTVLWYIDVCSSVFRREKSKEQTDSGHVSQRKDRPYYLYNNDYSEEAMKGQWARNILMKNANQFMSAGEIYSLSTMSELNANYNLALLAYDRLLS